MCNIYFKYFSKKQTNKQTKLIKNSENMGSLDDTSWVPASGKTEMFETGDHYMKVGSKWWDFLTALIFVFMF